MDKKKQVVEILNEFNRERYSGETVGEFDICTKEFAERIVKLFAIPVVMPRISHFVDTNGKMYCIENAEAIIEPNGAITYNIDLPNALHRIEVKPVYEA